MMRRSAPAPALALALACLPPAEALADPMALAMEAAAADCAAEGGRLEVAEGAAQLLDLTGDGSADDALVWEYGAFCAPDLGFRGGSGGAMLHLAVGDVVQSLPAGAWTLTDAAFTFDGETGPPVRILLIAQHGSQCGGAGASACIEAVTWDAGERRFMTVAPAGAE